MYTKHTNIINQSQGTQHLFKIQKYEKKNKKFNLKKYKIT